MCDWAQVTVYCRSPCDMSSSHYPCRTWTELCRSLFAALIITAQPNTTRSAANDSNLNWELMLTKHKLFSFCKGWSNLLWKKKKEVLVDIQNQSSIDWGKFQLIGREADNQNPWERRRGFSRSWKYSCGDATEGESEQVIRLLLVKIWQNDSQLSMPWGWLIVKITPHLGQLVKWTECVLELRKEHSWHVR